MNYFGSKTLETERLILHQTYEKDLKEVSIYYLTSKIHSDWEEEAEFQYRKLENASKDDVFTWTIEVKDENVVIGQISMVDTEVDSIKDIGWFLDPRYQKKGYAYEAAMVVLKYMFLEVGIDEVRTCCAIDNPNSWKLMERLGFQRSKERKFLPYTLLEGEAECFCYSVTKYQFLKEYFRKESLFICLDIDKDPFIKHLSDDLVLNITGESGSGKSYATLPYRGNPDCIVIDTDEVFGRHKRSDECETLYQYFQSKYGEIPDLCQDFDKIYCDILDFYKDLFWRSHCWFSTQ